MDDLQTNGFTLKSKKDHTGGDIMGIISMSHHPTTLLNSPEEI